MKFTNEDLDYPCKKNMFVVMYNDVISKYFPEAYDNFIRFAKSTRDQYVMDNREEHLKEIAIFNVFMMAYKDLENTNIISHKKLIGSNGQSIKVLKEVIKRVREEMRAIYSVISSDLHITKNDNGIYQYK